MTSAACIASNQISYFFSIFHRLAATRHLIQNTMSVCGVRRVRRVICGEEMRLTECDGMYLACAARCPMTC